MIHQAYYNLYPEVVSVDDDLGPLDAEGNQLVVDMALVEAESLRLEQEEAVVEYQIHREFNYPSIGDQLDALFHAGAFPQEMADQIQAVKDKYPKGV